MFSYRSAFDETGAFAVYCGTAPEHVDEVLDLVNAELDRLVRDGGVSERELVSAKGHLTGSLALSLESSASRMHRIGRHELSMGEVPTLDEVVAESKRSTPTTSRGSSTGSSRRGSAPSPWSARSTPRSSTRT